jgi:hypothetical protein
MQQVTLPSYEEALRDSGHGSVPATSSTNHGSASRHAPIFESGLSVTAVEAGGHHPTAHCAANDRSALAGHHGTPSVGAANGVAHAHAPHSPYRPHAMNEPAGGAPGIHVSQSSRHHAVRQAGRGGVSHGPAAARNPESRTRHHHTASSVSGSQIPNQVGYYATKNMKFSS